MTVLLDDDEHKPPTFLNIIESFKALSEESLPGDAVFIQFSGHGGRVLDLSTDAEAGSYDEVIAPSDYAVSGLIRDTLIFKTLLAPMRYGVTVTILIDGCDTGMVMELPYTWNPKNYKKNSIARLSVNNDFSFVRFLKVVKTIYEASAFTRLGKVVGSALSPRGYKDFSRSKQDDMLVSSEDISPEREIPNSEKNSFFDKFTGACRPDADLNKLELTETINIDSPKDSYIEKYEKELPPETLLDQVMGCVFMVPPEEEYFSDGDTFLSKATSNRDFDSPSTLRSNGSISDVDSPNSYRSRQKES